MPLDIYSGFEPHIPQWQIWNSPARFVVACCGRRFGKTQFARLRAGKNAAEGGRFGYFTLKNATMEQVWEDVKGWLKPAIKDKSEQFHRLEYTTGGVAEFWSLENEDAGLSRWYNEVIVDEAAIVKSARAWQRNIRPTLTDKRGRAYFFSTPRGMNWFYDLFRHGTDPTWPNWASFQFPTLANPYIDPDEIEEARRSLPERTFRQEYLAQFLSDEGEVFRNVDKLCVLPEREPDPAHAYVIGADWARTEDFSCFAVYDCTAREVCVLDRSNGVEFKIQINRLQGLAAKWHPIAILVEQNSMAGVIEDLQRTSLPIIPFHTSAPSKMLLVDALTIVLEREEIRLIDHEVLKEELKAYRPYPLPSGLVRYSAPEGMHDDTVMAVMLAYYCGQSQVAGEVGVYKF